MAKPKPQDMRKTLAQLLVSLRHEAGLRQVDLAQRLRKPQSFVSKYESGERRLDLVELYSICQVLKVPLSELVKRFQAANEAKP